MSGTINNKHTVKTMHVVDGQLVIETIAGLKFTVQTGSGGSGDMLKSVYDLNDDGKVSNSDSSDSLVFDGNRAIKALPTVGFDPAVSTLEEWIEKSFYPFLPATILLNPFASLEVGVQTSPNILGSLTLNDETVVTTRYITRDPLGTPVVIDNPVTDTINYTDTAITIVKGTNNEYQLSADVANDGSPITIFSAIENIQGHYPFLSGMDANGSLAGTGLYDAFSATKNVTGKADQSINFNDTNKYIYFAYDFAYGDLTSILDQNGFEVINSFTKTLISVTSTGLFSNYTYNFNVYTSDNLTTVNNGIFQFKF